MDFQAPQPLRKWRRRFLSSATDFQAPQPLRTRRNRCGSSADAAHALPMFSRRRRRFIACAADSYGGHLSSKGIIRPSRSVVSPILHRCRGDSIMERDAKKKILTYLLLAFALSSIFYYLILSHDKGKMSTLPVLGLMWCPGVAGLATRLIYQGNLRGIGWGWGRTRYQVASYLLPLAGGLLVYGIAWLTGLGGFRGAVSHRPLAVSLFLLATVG